MHRLSVLCLVIVLAHSAALTAAETHLAETPSAVLRLTIPGMVDEQYDVDLVLLARDGAFHHGYGLLPKRDNLPHRIDLTPSAAIAFMDKAGAVIEVPKHMTGRYAYKHKDFKGWKARYDSGDIDIVATQPLSPLAIEGKRISGVVDLLVSAEDEANTAGRRPSDRAFRLALELSLDGNGQVAQGEAVIHSYNAGDPDYGKDNPRKTIAVSGGWQAESWQADSLNVFAPGTDWPMAHGPGLLAAAAPFEGEFVNSLHDARLVWVAEDKLPSGRSGGRSRGGFAMAPYSWTTIGYGGYGAPIIADGKVFVFVHEADMAAIEAHEATASDPFLKLGVEKPSLGTVLGLVRDAVYAYDARTGQRLWHFHGKTGGISRESKSGMASTPCFYDGKIFVRGQGGLYALDAASGELLWQKGGSDAGGYGIGGAAAEGSVTQVGGTLILNSAGRDAPPTTMGVDPADGSLLWHHRQLGSGAVGIPGVYREDGKPYLVLGREAWKPGKRNKNPDAKPTPDTFVMVDPVDGRILWESDALKASSVPILVRGDIAIGNGVGPLHGEKKKSDKVRLAAARISTKGAEALWQADNVVMPSTRTMTVIEGDMVLVDNRKGFRAVDIKTGMVIKGMPHIYHQTQGSHNWTWHVAANGRMFTSGVAMFELTDSGPQLLPGRLSLDITSGYRSPTKPAIADGRIVLRLSDKLVCYDLRKRPEDKTQAIVLTAEHAVPASAEHKDVEVLIRQRTGELISAGAKVGRLGGREQWQFINWAGDWTGAMAWRKTIPYDLELSDDALTGVVPLRMGWNEEPFEVDLKRDGDRFTGTYTRIIPALPTIHDNQGDLSGAVESAEATGATVYRLSLAKGIGSSTTLVDGAFSENLEVFLVMNSDGALSHGWGVCGRMNTVTHEVDARDLSITDAGLSGELRIITHDDQYLDLHYANAQAKHAAAVNGSAVGIRYQVNATIAEDRSITGTFTGQVGAEIRIEGSMSGSLQPEKTWLGLD